MLVTSIIEGQSALPSREFQLVDMTHGFEVPGVDASDAVLTNAFAVWIVAYSYSIIGDEFVGIPWWLPMNLGRHEILVPITVRRITIAGLKHIKVPCNTRVPKLIDNDEIRSATHPVGLVQSFVLLLSNDLYRYISRNVVCSGLM